MLRRCSVSLDRLNRRPEDVFMVFQPPVLQFVDSDRLKTERGRGTDFDLCIDLGRHLLCDRAFRTDTAANAPPIVIVGEVPNLPSQIRSYFADAEGVFLSH